MGLHHSASRLHLPLQYVATRIAGHPVNLFLFLFLSLMPTASLGQSGRWKHKDNWRLAMQGDFDAHRIQLEELGAKAVLVRMSLLASATMPEPYGREE
jgi:hypothetical protein